MDIENETIEENTTEDLEQSEIPVQRQEFKISMPGGREIESSALSDDAYKVAAGLQFLQRQIEELSKHVQEFNLKQDHFELKMKQFIELAPSDEKTNS